MPETTTLSALLAFAVLFGLRHGLDADHLAAIDGLARAQASQGRLAMARRSGLLFSVGHGLVLLVVALACHVLGAPPLPDWFEAVGAWISILFLLTVATVNLQLALSPRPVAAQGGARLGWLLGRVIPLGTAGGIAVGALFALSFDALSLAAWFFLAGSAHGSVGVTLALVSAFVAGMVATDAVNGWVVARLIGRSEGFVERSRRLFALALSFIGFGIAGLGLLRMQLGAVDEWVDAHSLWVGALVVALSVAAFALAAGRSAGLRHSAIQQ